MGQITNATIKMIRDHIARGEHPPLTAHEIDQLATAWERDQPAASAEPLVMKEICPECGHQFACFHNPYINQLRAAPVAAQAQPSAQDREDAERYRWLRPFGVAGLSDAQSFLQCQMVDGNTDHGRMMDAAIDAARAAKGE